MATTSIWAVKSRMDHVIDYAENQDKTRNEQWSKVDYQSMRDVMDYAMNDAKTEQQFFVSGWNCDPDTARDEMQNIKVLYVKENKILAYHGYQSFKPGEVTPKIAHEIGVKLAHQLWPDYQVIVATHLDKAHIHNHFVVNSVSLNGNKFNATKNSYKEMRVASDRLCKQYGLSVITEQQAELKKHYAEWAAENAGAPTWRSLIRNDIDSAIKISLTFQQFINAMKKKGYVFERRGSFLRVKTGGMKRFVRLRSIGEGYSEQEILQRILQQRYRSYDEPEKPIAAARVKVQGDFRLSKVTWKGLRALYFFYLRKLRAAAAHPKQPYPFALKDDLWQLDAISAQSKFLNRYKLDSGEQVEALKESLSRKLTEIQNDKKALNNEKRRVGTADDRIQEIQARMAQLSEEARRIRKDLKLCDDVLDRSLMIEEKNKVLRELEQQNVPQTKQRTKASRNFLR